MEINGLTNYAIKFSKGESTICERNMEEARAYANEVAQSQGLTVISITEQAQNNGRYGKGFCHYCGMDAIDWGFFNEPVCGGCN